MARCILVVLVLLAATSPALSGEDKPDQGMSEVGFGVIAVLLLTLNSENDDTARRLAAYWFRHL